MKLFFVLFTLRVVHKLRWQDFFDHLAPCVDMSYGMNVDKKWKILGPPTYLVL